MTAPLPTPNAGDYSSHGLRSYREAASYLAENERLKGGSRQRSTTEAQGQRKVSPCGSPPRFRPGSSSRCRSRSPPQASSPSEGSPSVPKAKAPRSVSPGGTAASSAGAALRSSRTQGSPAKAPRRVSWADSLVASVRTRPRTPRKDVASLFYSRADERRFRREAEEDLPDDEWCEQLEDDSLASLSDEEDELPPTSPPPAAKEEEGHADLWSPGRERKDYAISKAVVVFGDSTRTYGATAPLAGGCAVEAALEAEAAFSFDDAAFWNGQLTWS